MDAIKEFFATMAYDKKLHFVAGLLAGLFGALLSGNYGLPVFFGGVAMGVAAGLAKEAFDAVRGGVVDRMDFAYTAVGGIPAAAVVAFLA